jgi:gamma-glutamylcyclotransferase (GGCT)/AIG2-like uncharacterized protein YtfP
MNPNLFVYGSLTSTSRHPMGERLRREARLVGEATIEGRLYKISWYPGLVAGGQSDERVHGEVYALQAPAHALAWLDEYEGLVPANPDAAEYERTELPARLTTGETITSWVYVYRKNPADLVHIPSGRWVPEPH